MIENAIISQTRDGYILTIQKKKECLDDPDFSMYCHSHSYSESEIDEDCDWDEYISDISCESSDSYISCEYVMNTDISYDSDISYDPNDF